MNTIPRTAYYAWSPVVGNSLLLATGTVAGAVNEDFDDQSMLEIFDVVSNKVIGSVKIESKFNCISWTPPSKDYSKGTIICGLESGVFEIYDTQALLDHKESGAMVQRKSQHTGPIKSLSVNPSQPSLLVTAGKAEYYVWNLDDLDEHLPTNQGAKYSRNDTIGCVAWNNSASYILALGGTSGYVTIMDLRKKKEIIALFDKAKPISTVAWHPSQATDLVTASDDDQSPAICYWDLRNSHAPKKILQGHEQGILSLSWCTYDADLLISSGKDNKVMVWNPNTGDRIGEYARGSNWIFQVSFAPTNPSFFAAASYDQKIVIHSLQNLKRSGVADSEVKKEAGGAAIDFFERDSYHDPTAPSFSLPQPPKWLKVPVSAHFSFGGKLAIVKSNSRTVHLETIQMDKDAVDKAAEAESTEVDPLEFCKDQASNNADPEWEVIQTLFQKDSRRKIIEYLGVDKRFTEIADVPVEKVESANMDVVATPPPKERESEAPSEAEIKDETAPIETVTESTTEKVNEEEIATTEIKLDSLEITDDTSEKKSKRLSKFFAEDDGDSDFLAGFSHQTNGVTAETLPAKTTTEKPIEEPLVTKKPAMPFDLVPEGASSIDLQITREILRANFEAAADICLKESRIGDAFLIGICGGDKILDKVKRAYIGNGKSSASYLRLLGAIDASDIEDISSNGDLKDWKETLTLICTYASPDNFSKLCGVLGERLLAKATETDSVELRKNAALVFIVGGLLERVVEIWLIALKEKESAELAKAISDGESSETSFSVHLKALEEFIKKVTIYRQATNYVDKDLNLSGNFKLAALYDIYGEYANIFAAYGKFDIAKKYVDKTPVQYSGTKFVRDLITVATTPKSKSRSEKPTSSKQAYSSLIPPTQIGSSQGYQKPSSSIPANTIQQPPSRYGTTQPLNSQARASPKPSLTGNWNDAPTIAPNNRHVAPALQPVSSPFLSNPKSSSNQPPLPNSKSNGPPPPPIGASVISPRQSSANLGGLYAPPPRQAQPPQLNAQPPYPSYNRSNVSSPAPPPPSSISSPPRKSNVVSSSQPPSSNYAPPQRPNNQGPPQNTFDSHGQGYGRPPSSIDGRSYPSPQIQNAQLSNNYGPPPPGRQASSYAPPPQQLPDRTITPNPPAPPKVQKQQPPPPKYRDRSHIPSQYIPIYEILNSELERAKPNIAPQFKRQMQDTEKRLNILFDLINNEQTLSKDTLNELLELAAAMSHRDYQTAYGIHVDLLTTRSDECGQWMVGVKRLIEIARSLP